MTYVVCEPCIGTKDHACVDVCPVDCFYEGEDILLIHPDECIDCGACVPECPVEAIFAEDDVPEQWKSYTARNSDPFKAGEKFPTSKKREDWEKERAEAGTFANLYYTKFPKK